MQLTAIAAAMVAAASVVSADYLTILQRQEVTGFTQRSNAIWHADNGRRHPTPANIGCWDKPVEGVNTICFDWGKNRRAHWFASNNPGRKRCFAEWNEHFLGSCYQGGICSMHRWHEVPCTW